MIKPKIIIVGGGLGGLNVTKQLKKCDVDILLIDKTNHHLFQPLLYQVASAALSPGEIATPIREIFRKQKNTTVMMGEVVKINKTSKELTLANGETINYDYLILAVGSRHSYFGHPEWAKYAFGLKTIQDALAIREKILLSFEKAERFSHTDPEVSKYLNFVVVGGGPTGVEMAGAIAEIAHKTMFKNFRRINPEKSKIYLIEATPRILSMYSEKLAKKAREYLKKMGVIVIEGKRVIDVHEEGVQLEDAFYPSTNIIWAAGNEASHLLKTLDTPLDRQGRAIVNRFLSIPGHENIFVIGDAASCSSKNGMPLPGVGAVAIQQGRYVGKWLNKKIHKLPTPQPFEYWDKGSMATIGKGKAIAAIGKFQISGIFAWILWGFVHITYLIGFRNRLTVMIEWILFYTTGQRGARLIYSSVEHEHEKSS